MTEDGFKRYLAPYIRDKVPFSAYWYSRGYGLIKTGLIPTEKTEYLLCQNGKAVKSYGTTERGYHRCQNAINQTEGAWMETRKVPGKPRQLTEGMVKRWKKNLDQLRHTCGCKFVTVDFDGEHIMTEGDFEL